jgi:hypothetical protein
MTAARTLPVMELRPGLKDVRRPAELMHAYIVLSLLCGFRTEEARALRWAPRRPGRRPASQPARPAAHSRLAIGPHPQRHQARAVPHLALPAASVQALRAWSGSQAGEQLTASQSWQDTGLVFTSHRGAALDAGNVRKMFKRICTEAGAGNGWPPASCAPRSSA